MKTITCERCGKQVERYNPARLCFDCAAVNHHEQARQSYYRRREGKPNVKTCKLCGKEFTPKRNQQYCSPECSHDAYLESQKNYYVNRLKARRKRAKKITHQCANG